MRIDGLSTIATRFDGMLIDQFGVMEFTALPRIVEVGYRHAVAQVAAWEQAGRFADIPHGRIR